MKVLILGVGSAQIDLIEYCKNRGDKVFAVANSSQNATSDLVDGFMCIDILDKQRVLQYARQINADLICSIGSDFALATIAYVSKQLALPCFIDEKIINCLCHKNNFRQTLEELNINNTPYQVAEDLTQLQNWQLFPAIIKPVDSQGQRGIFKVANKTALAKCFNNALSYSRSQTVIIEKYHHGQEISVNTIVANGEVVANYFSNRIVHDNHTIGIVKEHCLAAIIPPLIRNKAITMINKLVEHCNIINGPLYFQLKYQQDKIYFIEASPRLDGCHLWRLFKTAYGIDLLDLTFLLTLNQNFQLLKVAKQNICSPFKLIYHLQKPATRFKTQPRQSPAHIYERFYYQQDQIVNTINGQLEKVGYYIKKLPTRNGR